MDSPPENPSPLRLLPPDWITRIFQLYGQLRQFLNWRVHEGIYEILEYDGTLELVDPKGHKAVFKKRLRVRFLQDYVIAFQDHAWGDGETLARYTCSPGVEVDRYRDGDRWNILTSLREIKRSGDTQDFYIQRTIQRGFTHSEEWWQLEMYHATRSLKCSILFPRKRPCRRAVLVERSENRTTPLEARHFAHLPDGRQILTWETQRPRRFETYTLKWRW